MMVICATGMENVDLTEQIITTRWTGDPDH